MFLTLATHNVPRPPCAPLYPLWFPAVHPPEAGVRSVGPAPVTRGSPAAVVSPGSLPTQRPLVHTLQPWPREGVMI